MGYDCTLHLVDEKAIREELVPRLLGRTRKQTVLDRVMENAEELWSSTQNALRDEDPDIAAALLCQLAVSFSACSLPHQYERGFALSLWDSQEKDIAKEYPSELAFSPEVLFAEVVKEYPQLAGRFPTWFTGNYSTGVFIPTDRVAEALAWVEGQIAPMARGDQRQFRGLLGILRAAADRGLAYWEATDLAVPMINTFPGDPNLMIAHYLGNEPSVPGRQVEEAPLEGHFRSLSSALVGDYLVSGDFNPFETSFWEMSTWPPRLAKTLPEFAVSVARSRAGRWMLLSETDSRARPRSFRPRLYSSLDGTPEQRPVVVDGKDLSVREGGFVGDQPVVFRSPEHNVAVGDILPSPLWLQGKTWTTLPGLPEVKAKPSPLRDAVEDPVTGVIYLGDGSDVVIWDGDGYELGGGQFAKTFPMDVKTGYVSWTSAPAGKDGFFYLSNRKLFEVHRQGAVKEHGKRWKNIMAIRPGPAGSLLLQEGDNKDGDVAKLYFPADGSFIHIEPELFDHKDYPFITWSPTTDRFIVLAGKFLAIETAAVLSLPRYRASTGRQIKR